MAPSATASKPAKTKAAKPARSSGKKPTGKPLQYRYPAVMKPQRVYDLTVSVPKTKKPSTGDEPDVVVIRPIIPGAQVVPSEQRLDTTTVGNQITFSVTPLAKGRLPRARVEIFTPTQAPQSVPLRMKGATQRAAWVFLILAFVVPWVLTELISGSWRPRGATPDGKTDAAVVMGFRVRAALGGKDDKGQLLDIKRAWYPADLPVVNTKESSLPLGLGEITLADQLGTATETSYLAVEKAVNESRATPIAFIVLLLLSFVCWAQNRPRSARVKKPLNLPPASHPVETAPLETF